MAMDFFEVVKARHSVRSFKEKKVPEKSIQKILETVNAAPSAGDLQGFEVVLVQEGKTKKALSEAALGQPSVAEAPIVLVFFASPERSSGKYGERGTRLYCVQDAAIAAAYAQLCATALGLSSVWVGAFEDADVSQALSAPENLIPVAMLPIGFPAEKPKATPRRALDDLIKKESF